MPPAPPSLLTPAPPAATTTTKRHRSQQGIEQGLPLSTRGSQQEDRFPERGEGRTGENLGCREKLRPACKVIQQRSSWGVRAPFPFSLGSLTTGWVSEGTGPMQRLLGYRAARRRLQSGSGGTKEAHISEPLKSWSPGHCGGILYIFTYLIPGTA